MNQVKYQNKKRSHNRNINRRDCDCSHDYHERDCICSQNLCDSHFRLRLGGLKDNLNYRLRQLKDRVVILELEYNQELEARICAVGSDFVEVDVVRMVKVFILPFEEIKDVTLKDN